MVLPPLLALLGVLTAVVVAMILFARHPALALLPVGALAFGVYLFAKWEQGRFRRPDA